MVHPLAPAVEPEVKKKRKQKKPFLKKKSIKQA